MQGSSANKECIVRKKIIYSLVSLLFCSTANAQAEFIKYKKYLIPIAACEKPRVIVSTDYGTLGSDVDPNEPQDLVHFLAYSNHFDVRAIIASTNPNAGTKGDLDDPISRYENDFNNHFLTSSNGPEYPTPSYLEGVLYNGVAKGGSYTTSLPPNSNLSTDKIIAEAASASPTCLLNLLVWGSMTDVAAAMYQMPVTDRDNLRVIAIGSTNKDEDTAAWTYVRDIQNAGGTLISENIILSDNGNPNAFRSLFLGSNCGVNPVLYDSVGVETIMNSLSDSVSASNNGLRGLLQLTRDEVSNIHCQPGNPNFNPNAKNSLRIADSLTTLYLLDEVLDFGGDLEDIIDNNDGSSTTGIGRDSVLRGIYNHFMNRMDDIYN